MELRCSGRWKGLMAREGYLSRPSILVQGQLESSGEFQVRLGLADLLNFVMIVLALIDVCADNSKSRVLEGLHISCFTERPTLVACGHIPPGACLNRRREQK